MVRAGHAELVAPARRRSADDALAPYRARRDPARTPEPFGSGPGRGDLFVVQEHHARALHWDVRLERDGVLVSWAVPKGLPLDPARNHLAKHTENHPLDYADFEGEIPAGEYGGGRVTVWDRGRYTTEKWTDDEVKVVLSGSRVSGRYVFFRTSGTDWMVHRMDRPPEGWTPLPTDLAPMLAVAGPVPADSDGWSFEFKWDGIRALAAVEGGRLRLTSRTGRDVTGSYPELAGFAEALGSTPVLLDGEVVALGPAGVPDFGLLQTRMHVARPAQARRLAVSTPVHFFAFDVLHLDGRSLLARPYTERRAALAGLGLVGPAQVPPAFPGAGPAVLAAARERGLEGVVGKRADSPYLPGRRSDCWVKTKIVHRQPVVIGGWEPGEGGRAGTIGALLVGVRTGRGLEYAGQVGTGFTEAVLRELAHRLAPLRRPTPPFADPVPRPYARTAVWVEPVLVAEVVHGSWTRDGRLRHPSYQRLRDDLDPADAVRED
jgi:bifunctional non-homologous end joining protein LigD